MLLLPLPILLVLGCAQSSSAPSAVHGKVTYNSQPVTGGNVTFYDPQGAQYQFPIDKEGYYAGRDLPAGEMVVTVETESINPGKEAGKGDKYVDPSTGKPMDDPQAKMKEKMGVHAPPSADQSKGKYVKIPPRYAKKDSTPLKKTVSKGDNSINLELSD
jgi:hypothetical protein